MERRTRTERRSSDIRPPNRGANGVVRPSDAFRTVTDEEVIQSVYPL